VEMKVGLRGNWSRYKWKLKCIKNENSISMEIKVIFTVDKSGIYIDYRMDTSGNKRG